MVVVGLLGFGLVGRFRFGLFGLFGLSLLDGRLVLVRIAGWLRRLGAVVSGGAGLLLLLGAFGLLLAFGLEAAEEVVGVLAKLHAEFLAHVADLGVRECFAYPPRSASS